MYLYMFDMVYWDPKGVHATQLAFFEGQGTSKLGVTADEGRGRNEVR